MRHTKAFHDAVFQTVKRNHRQSSTGLQQCQPGIQALPQTFQLLVHRDPQRLKHARGRVPCTFATTHRSFHNLGKLRGRLDCNLITFPYNRCGNTPCSGLFAITPENFNQRSLIQILHQPGCRLPGRGVHTHIQRALPLETEPPLRCIKLIRRHTQIQYDAIHCRQPLTGCRGAHVRKVSLNQSTTIRPIGQRCAGTTQGLLILIQPQQHAIPPGSFQNTERMTAASQRSIDICPAWLYIQPGQHFRSQHGYMHRAPNQKPT